MQLMPTTARHVGIENPFDPRENILGGTKYLSTLLDRFKGNTARALAAYNAGKKNVREWLKAGGKKVLEQSDIPFIETRNFVEDVLSNYHWLKQIRKFRGKIVKKTEEAK